MIEQTQTFIPYERMSYSSIGLIRKCPQAWNYHYVQGLTETGPSSPALQLGTWWHALRAADAIERGGRYGSGTLIATLVPDTLGLGDGTDLDISDWRTTDGDRAPHLPSRVLSHAARHWNGLDEEGQQRWIDAYGVALPDLLDGMNRRWFAAHVDSLAHEEPLGVEVKFSRTFPGSETAVLTGYVDEVYRDKRRGVVVVRDYKTAKTIDAADSADDLMDSQLHLYVWGVQPTLTKAGAGQIQAVAYDRTRTKVPSRPTVTATGSLSKATSDYDLQTYLDWCAEGVEWGSPGEFYKTGKNAGLPKFGTYEADPQMVESLSSPVEQGKWAIRSMMPLNLNIIRAHLQAAVDSQDTARRVWERATESGEAPRNLTRNVCRWCEFSSLCRAQMLGGPDGEYPLTDHGLKHRDTQGAPV